MESSYIQKVQSSLDDQLQASINNAKANCQTRIMQLQGYRPTYEPVKLKWLPIFVICGILAFFTNGITLIVFGLIALGVLLINLKRQMDVDDRNQYLSESITKAERERDAKIADLKKQFANMKYQEEESFKSNVKAFRDKYVQMSEIQPIVDWVATQFEKEIRAADRRGHVKMVSTTLIFRVNEFTIDVLKLAMTYDHLPKGGYTTVDSFNLSENNFTRIQSFERQVGLAQAVAKMVQFEITKRCPEDPLAPCAVVPTVNITLDDNTVHMHYTVPNGNYVSPVML